VGQVEKKKYYVWRGGLKTLQIKLNPPHSHPY